MPSAPATSAFGLMRFAAGSLLVGNWPESSKKRFGSSTRIVANSDAIDRSASRCRRKLALISGEALKERKRVVFSIFRSEEHTSELQSLMRISYAVFCLKKKKK